jgi:hypothetical protein
MEISPIQMRVNKPENDGADLLTPTRAVPASALYQDYLSFGCVGLAKIAIGASYASATVQ